MTAKQAKLEAGLEEALAEFKANMESNLDTFQGQYLTKDDMEEISRQMYYCMAAFKDHITKYLKE